MVLQTLFYIDKKWVLTHTNDIFPLDPRLRSISMLGKHSSFTQTFHWSLRYAGKILPSINVKIDRGHTM